MEPGFEVDRTSGGGPGSGVRNAVLCRLSGGWVLRGTGVRSRSMVSVFVGGRLEDDRLAFGTGGVGGALRL